MPLVITITIGDDVRQLTITRHLDDEHFFKLWSRLLPEIEEAIREIKKLK